MGRIYTRSGDQGTTGLIGGTRIAKSDPRIACLGTLDEANACLGLAVARLDDSELIDAISTVQSELFDIGALLGSPHQRAAPIWLAVRVKALETDIDRWWTEAGPLSTFLLPGGRGGGAELHLARAVIRRLERHLTLLEAPSELRQYVNRLSDYLFAAARIANRRRNDPERQWQPRGEA